MESVCRGELRRPLHCQELLLPTILKWADWSEEERKNNQLVFGRHPVIDQLFRNETVYKLKEFALIMACSLFLNFRNVSGSSTQVHVRSSLFQSKEQRLPAMPFRVLPGSFHSS